MKKNPIAYFILGSAIIWAFVMIGISLILKGTEFKQDVNLILYGGFTIHLLFVWGLFAIILKKKNEHKPKKGRKIHL